MSDDDLRARVAEVLSAPCGRCSGKGTERHQIDRDPAAGYADWPCPSCRGAGVTVPQRTPEQLADAVLAALPRYEQVPDALWCEKHRYLGKQRGTCEMEPVYRRLPTEGVQP